jgi:hypothetical protein
MLQNDKLPPATAALLDDVSVIPAIAEFTLIGGTALALAWGHRRSEDLDFAIFAEMLPKSVCASIRENLSEKGWRFASITDPDAYFRAVQEGYTLTDIQEDWLCGHADFGKVKVTFFAEFENSRRPAYDVGPDAYGHVRIMKPEALFSLKSQLLLRRSLQRDLFDILSFLQRGWTLEAVYGEMLRADAVYDFNHEIFRTKLLPSRFPATDPGLQTLVDDGPKTGEEIKALLAGYLDAFERQIAEEAIERLESDAATREQDWEP